MKISEQQKTEHWLKQIDDLIGNKHYRWAREALRQIRSTIEETGQVTDRQIQAIKNIKWSKNKQE